MRLTVLGSGTCLPSLERGAACHLVEAAGQRLVFDLGSGALRSLLAAGVAPQELTHLFLTHLHPDHTADLVPYLFACNYAPGWEGRPPLQIHGPHGLRRFFRELQGPYPWVEPRGWDCAIFEHRREGIEGPGWRVGSFPVEHGRLEALAYRVESGGRSLCYSGDTGFCEGLVEAARAVDLLLCEATLPQASLPMEGHMRTDHVALAAHRSGARRVVLTHLYPPPDGTDLAAEVRLGYEGPVEVARDGATYEV